MDGARRRSRKKLMTVRQLTLNSIRIAHSHACKRLGLDLPPKHPTETHYVQDPHCHADHCHGFRRAAREGQGPTDAEVSNATRAELDGPRFAALRRRRAVFGSTGKAVAPRPFPRAAARAGIARNE